MSLKNELTKGHVTTSQNKTQFGLLNKHAIWSVLEQFVYFEESLSNCCDILLFRI